MSKTTIPKDRFEPYFLAAYSGLLAGGALVTPATSRDEDPKTLQELATLNYAHRLAFQMIEWLDDQP